MKWLSGDIWEPWFEDDFPMAKLREPPVTLPSRIHGNAPELARLRQRCDLRGTWRAIEAGELRWEDFLGPSARVRHMEPRDVEPILDHFSEFGEQFGWEGEWYGHGVSPDAFAKLMVILVQSGPLRHVPGLTKPSTDDAYVVDMIDYYHLGTTLAALHRSILGGEVAEKSLRRSTFAGLLEEASGDWRTIASLVADPDESTRGSSRRTLEAEIRFQTIATSLLTFLLTYLAGLSPAMPIRDCQYCGEPTKTGSRGRPPEYCPDHQSPRFRQLVRRGNSPAQIRAAAERTKRSAALQYWQT